MPVYEVIFTESRELTYVVEAATPDEASERAGALWCSDAEPADIDGVYDITSVQEVA